MSKPVCFRGVILLAVLVLISACQSDPQHEPAFVCEDPLGCVTVAPGDPVIIASIQALTGNNAAIGQSQDRAIRMALAERGDSVLGHPVVISSEDDGCTREGGANAALRAVADPRLVAVLGTACSGAASGAMPIVSDAGLVMISGANTAPALTSLAGERGEEWHPGYFRAIYNGDDLAMAGARFAVEELGIRRAATVNDGDLYSRGVARSFQAAFAELGGTITADITINKGDQDYGPALRAIANSNPELIYMPIFPAEARFLMAQAGDYLPLDTIVFLATESLLVDDFLREIDPAVTLYFTTATSFANPNIAALMERYRALYDDYPHPAFRYAYDAVHLLLYALETAAIQDQDGTLHIGRQKLRDALYSVRGFEGVSGVMSCDAFGDCSRATFYVVRISDPSAGLVGVLSNVVTSYHFE